MILRIISAYQPKRWPSGELGPMPTPLPPCVHAVHRVHGGLRHMRRNLILLWVQLSTFACGDPVAPVSSASSGPGCRPRVASAASGLFPVSAGRTGHNRFRVVRHGILEVPAAAGWEWNSPALPRPPFPGARVGIAERAAAYCLSVNSVTHDKDHHADVQENGKEEPRRPDARVRRECRSVPASVIVFRNAESERLRHHPALDFRLAQDGNHLRDRVPGRLACRHEHRPRSRRGNLAANGRPRSSIQIHGVLFRYSSPDFVMFTTGSSCVLSRRDAHFGHLDIEAEFHHVGRDHEDD